MGVKILPTGFVGRSELPAEIGLARAGGSRERGQAPGRDDLAVSIGIDGYDPRQPYLHSRRNGREEMISGFTRRFKALEFMNSEEEEAIHRGALYVLEKTGMRIQHERALKSLADSGCEVDFEDERARIHPSLVEESIRKVPSNFVLRARDRDKDLMVGGDTVYFMQGMGMRYVDLETWETRPATAAEHRDAMIVADALENIHLAEGWEIYTDRKGIPPVMGLLENLASAIRYSSKAQVAGNIKDTEIFAIKMAKAVGIDLFPEIEHACPLAIQTGGVEAAYRYMEAGIPIVPALSVSMGATGPATMAGAVLLQVAEMMGWVVIAQLFKPGAPLAFHHGASPPDMRTGNKLVGVPSRGITSAMMNQMLRRYQIPIWSNTGFASNSKKIDFQAGFEKSTGTLLSALSGGHVHLFQGGSSLELLFSPELAVMEDDVAGWIGHVLEGAIFTDETLAIDLINQVGPMPGHYLATAHTRECWQKENYFPQVTDIESYPSWIHSDRKDMLKRAKEKVEEILASHKPMPLTPEQEQAIEDILNEARDYYRENHVISDAEWSEYMKELESVH
jgi:trimethylamine--corrinoid protein Co-methyltransferase